MTDFQTEDHDAADNFQRVETAVRLWVQNAMRLENVTWHRDPSTMFGAVDKAAVTLTMMSSVAVGSDEIRRSFNDQTTVQTVAQVGIRVVEVQVKVESFDKKLSSHTLYERLRTHSQAARLNYSTELRDQNISFNDLSKAINLPTSYDTLVISACAGTLTLNVAAVVLDSPEDWVESANVSGEASE